MISTRRRTSRYRKHSHEIAHAPKWTTSPPSDCQSTAAAWKQEDSCDEDIAMWQGLEMTCTELGIVSAEQSDEQWLQSIDFGPNVDDHVEVEEDELQQSKEIRARHTMQCMCVKRSERSLSSTPYRITEYWKKSHGMGHASTRTMMPEAGSKSQVVAWKQEDSYVEDIAMWEDLAKMGTDPSAVDTAEYDDQWWQEFILDPSGGDTVVKDDEWVQSKVIQAFHTIQCVTKSDPSGHGEEILQVIPERSLSITPCRSKVVSDGLFDVLLRIEKARLKSRLVKSLLININSTGSLYLVMNAFVLWMHTQPL
jgi:hypothetical protein